MKTVYVIYSQIYIIENRLIKSLYEVQSVHFKGWNVEGKKG